MDLVLSEGVSSEHGPPLRTYPFVWDSFRPQAKAVLHSYSDITNSLTGLLDQPAALQLAQQLLVHTVLYLLSKRSGRLPNTWLQYASGFREHALADQSLYSRWARLYFPFAAVAIIFANPRCAIFSHTSAAAGSDFSAAISTLAAGQGPDRSPYRPAPSVESR